VKTTYFSSHRVLPVFLLFCLAEYLSCSRATSAPTTPPGRDRPAAVQSGSADAARFDAPIISETSERMEGVLAEKDFFIRLPEHIRYEQGTELILSFRSSPLLLPDVSTMSVSFNGRPVTSLRLGNPAGGSTGKEVLRLPIDAAQIQPGWNRLGVRCLMQTTQVPCRDVDNPAAWIEMDAASRLRVAYTPQPLFPELQRFPDALAESRLMAAAPYSGEAVKDEVSPSISVLVPVKADDAELRAFAIACSRLAQTLYIRDDALAVGDVSVFAAESVRRNGILIGTKSALAECGLPSGLQTTLASLGAGEGCLAEIIIGESPKAQHRWIIVAGSDQAGLEKAALTLGSTPAIQSVPSNPWIIRDIPAVPPLVEQLARPTTEPVALRALAGEITMRGLFRHRADCPLTLPPGYQTGENSSIELDISHAENLENASALNIKINDSPVAGIALTPDNASPTRKRVVVPAGIAGADPSKFVAASYLDIGTVDCGHRNEERAWVNLAGTTSFDLKAVPIVIRDLGRLDHILLRDGFLRRAAILVPRAPSWERMELIKTTAVFLGRKLPNMPILWPQVASYAAGQPADPARVANRSGLILGSSFDWPAALPESVPLVVRGSATSADRVLMRGEETRMADFDRTLSFAQLLRSPWTTGEVFAATGGLDGYAVEGTTALLTDPTVAERLNGTVAAIDSKRRVMTYDVRVIQDASLAEHLRRGLPPGGTLAESERMKKERAAAGIEAFQNNRILVALVAAGLLGVFLIQRLAIRRKNNGGGKPGGREE